MQIISVEIHLQQITVRRFVFYNTFFCKEFSFQFFIFYHENEKNICSDTVYIVYCPENDLDTDFKIDSFKKLEIIINLAYSLLF